MKYFIGAMAITVGLLIFYCIRFSRYVAGVIGAVMVHGLLTLWFLGCE
ncbi:MAG: hypothetical protein U0992_08170 [Planctomycetaceae bacterium]